jgi:hypothetical protein
VTAIPFHGRVRHGAHPTELAVAAPLVARTAVALEVSSGQAAQDLHGKGMVCDPAWEAEPNVEKKGRGGSSMASLCVEQGWSWELFAAGRKKNGAERGVLVLIGAEAGEELEGGPAPSASGAQCRQREQGRPTGGPAQCYSTIFYLIKYFQKDLNLNRSNYGLLCSNISNKIWMCR